MAVPPPNIPNPLTPIRAVLIGITLCNVAFTCLKLYRESNSSLVSLTKAHLSMMDKQNKLGLTTQTLLKNLINKQKRNIFEHEQKVEDAFREGILTERALRSCARQLAEIDLKLYDSTDFYRPAHICIALMSNYDLTDAQIRQLFHPNGEFKRCPASELTKIHRQVKEVNDNLWAVTQNFKRSK